MLRSFSGCAKVGGFFGASGSNASRAHFSSHSRSAVERASKLTADVAESFTAGVAMPSRCWFVVAVAPMRTVAVAGDARTGRFSHCSSHARCATDRCFFGVAVAGAVGDTRASICTCTTSGENPASRSRAHISSHSRSAAIRDGLRGSTTAAAGNILRGVVVGSPAAARASLAHISPHARSAADRRFCACSCRRGVKGVEATPMDRPALSCRFLRLSNGLVACPAFSREQCSSHARSASALRRRAAEPRDCEPAPPSWRIDCDDLRAWAQRSRAVRVRTQLSSDSNNDVENRVKKTLDA